MAKVLVTGGTGFIGSHIATELLSLGHDVILVDNFCNSSKEVLKGIKEITGKAPAFVEMDICDEAKVLGLFEDNKDIDAVIHLAALKAVGESVADPLLYYRNNLISSLNILSGMKEFGVNNFIYSSSACVYGKPEYLPLDEKHPLTNDANPYGKTKSMTEDILKHMSEAVEGFRVVSLRYFNPIGAHKSGLIGEAPKGVPANVTPYINQVAAGVLPHLRVFGNDYDTSDGTGVRDYIHILDLVDAHIVSLLRLVENNNEESFEVYNLGTGMGTSVLELLRMFEEVNGVKVPYKIYPRRAGDFDKVYNNPGKAKEKLNWKANYTVKEALADGWSWEKNLRNLK